MASSRSSSSRSSDTAKVIEIVDAGGTIVALIGIELTRRPDLGLVDLVARLQLVAARAGCSIRLRNPCSEMCGLLELVGLRDVIAVATAGDKGPPGGRDQDSRRSGSPKAGNSSG